MTIIVLKTQKYTLSFNSAIFNLKLTQNLSVCNLTSQNIIFCYSPDVSHLGSNLPIDRYNILDNIYHPFLKFQKIATLFQTNFCMSLTFVLPKLIF